jgi:hypothetical protein
MLKQVVDGFTYNCSLLYLPNRFFPNALAHLDILRRAANYRPRWFVIPDDIDQPIQPYDTLYYQFYVPGGSYLWGWSFACTKATDPNGNPATASTSSLAIQAVDSCTGIPLFQDFANAGQPGNLNGSTTSDFSARCSPILLTEPRLILDPGLVNVQIANLTGNTITCQLLLQFAEPCRTIDEADRVMEWTLMRQQQIAAGVK